MCWLTGIVLGALWRRKDGSNKLDRWNISKGAWRVMLALILLPLCYYLYGNCGIWIASVTLINMFMGFETMTHNHGWRHGLMMFRYSVLGFIATTNPIYTGACALAGLCYPIGNKYDIDNYTNWCEYIVGAVVLGGVLIL